MLRALVVAVVVAACVGVSSAEVTCSERCIKLAEDVNYALDPYTYSDKQEEFSSAGCDNRCLLFELTSTVAPPDEDADEWDRAGAPSKPRRVAARPSRLAADRHRHCHRSGRH